MIKFFNFVFFVVFTVSSSLYAANNSLQDVVIVYDVPHPTKQKFFTEIINKAVPYKTTADPYHVTLTWVENVNPQHHALLKAHLQTVANQSLSNAHFTPTSATQLATGPHSTLAMIPTEAEKKNFQQINHLLYSAVQQFNLQHHTSYKVKPCGLPNKYTPHVTIAKKNHIQNYSLNSQKVIQNVNLNLAKYQRSYGVSLDLLHITQPTFGPRAAAPKVSKRAVVRQRPAARVTKRAVVRQRPAARVTKRAVVRQRPARVTKRAAPRGKKVAAPRIRRKR